jgi:HEAT repeat protein
MATSNSQGINLMLNQMASSPHSSQRQLSALGAGLLGDETAIQYLIKLLDDSVPSIRSSSCLALVAIGSRKAMEALAEALLHGDEDLRQYAAEAFANHPEEGYPTLQEGSTIDDLLVRRAVVAGLKRIKEDWAIEILEKMRVDDPQWVVKNMADNALEELSQPDPHIPQPALPLHDTPWLISYAGESGEGISPGTIATDYLYRALREGNEEQILAAIRIILLNGESNAIPELYSYLYGENAELREAALNAVWHLAATGVSIPLPDEIA